MESNKDSHNTEDIGSIRWASDSEPATSNQENPSRITIHGKILSPSECHGKDEQSSFSMNINAFEKSLREKRDRQLHEHSPRIEFHLRETQKCNLPSLSKTHVFHVERESGSSQSAGDVSAERDFTDSIDNISPAPRKIKRVITYEKVLKTKSIREISYPRTIITSEKEHSPVVQRTVDLDRSSSTEPITPTEDSAYHSHRIRLVSSGTPTTISSSSDSIQQNVFLSDENVHTPSRERILFERAGSEPPLHIPSMQSCKNRSSVEPAKIVYVDDRAIDKQQTVTGGNENIRRNFDAYRTSSESEGISSDWYNEYQIQTVHVDRSNKMDFKRSNSQYDNHIRQIRGTNNNPNCTRKLFKFHRNILKIY